MSSRLNQRPKERLRYDPRWRDEGAEAIESRCWGQHGVAAHLGPPVCRQTEHIDTCYVASRRALRGLHSPSVVERSDLEGIGVFYNRPEGRR